VEEVGGLTSGCHCGVSDGRAVVFGFDGVVRYHVRFWEEVETDATRDR
jgi:hypothetical protein